MATKRQLAEKIQRQLAGILPPGQDEKFTLNYILTYINEAIGYFAKKSALENANLEGVMFANDSFSVTYTDLILKVDPTNSQQYLDLPSMPIGLPNNRGLVQLTPVSRFQSVRFKAINRKDVARYFSLCAPHNVAFYYIEDSKAKIIGCSLAKNLRFKLTMITADGGLDTTLNLPPDAQAELSQFVFNNLIRQTTTDLTNDGVSIDTKGTVQ